MADLTVKTVNDEQKFVYEKTIEASGLHQVNFETENTFLDKDINIQITTPAAAAPAAAPVAAAAPAAAPAPAAASLAAGEVVAAPMPGNILKVNVSQGAAVKSGDILVVLEAMKMENEILAPRDGTVAQVAVNVGATVDTGTPLVVLA